MMSLFPFLLLLFSLTAYTADAACTGSSPTWSATADESSVQTCITNAQNAGGAQTVTVAAGSFTVTTGLSVDMSTMTQLKLAGGGSSVAGTVVTDNASAISALIITNASASHFVEVTGFRFVAQAVHTFGIVRISGTLFSQGFRFHHNYLTSALTSNSTRHMYVVGLYGLVDNNTFEITAATGTHQMLSIDGTYASSDGGHPAWAQPLTLGSANAVYVENNTFTRNSANTNSDTAFDAYSGARYVVRYNTFLNDGGGHHGLDSGSNRSPVSFELYENTFTNDSTIPMRAWDIRGGTGVIFNNTYGGTVSTWNSVSLSYYRACGSWCAPNCYSTWKVCDGTQYKLESDQLGNAGLVTTSTTGTFGFDATSPDALPLCTHGVGNCTGFFDGTGPGGYPGRDQPGVGPGQVVTPIYFWNNIWGVANVGIAANDLGDSGNCNGLGVANYILSGRDFIDNGSTAKPGYTAYTYPHPLQNVNSGNGSTKFGSKGNGLF